MLSFGPLCYLVRKQYMSLTAFLKQADVRERFNAEFTKPPMDNESALLAPPLGKNNSVVGSAFDYLLRFYIERLNPKANTAGWIAEEIMNTRPLVPEYYQRLLDKARNHYDEYLLGGETNERLLRSVIHLANMEAEYRASDSTNFPFAGFAGKKDIRDLRQLISLVHPKMFKAKGHCTLNPVFGRASNLVGGTDCDIVIDDAIIEIKTVKDCRIERSYFNQLIGYYVLSRIGG